MAGIADGIVFRNLVGSSTNLLLDVITKKFLRREFMQVHLTQALQKGVREYGVVWGVAWDIAIRYWFVPAAGHNVAGSAFEHLFQVDIMLHWSNDDGADIACQHS